MARLNKISLNKFIFFSFFFFEAVNFTNGDPQHHAVPEIPLMDKYQWVKFLGEGNFGTVQQYQDTSSKKMVAIKTIYPKPIPRSLYRVEGASLPDPIEKEMEILRLASENCPNIVKFIDSWFDDTDLIMVMEYIDQSLDQIISTSPDGLDVPHLSRMLLQAVSHIHNLNIMHRDIKPSNLLYDNISGLLKLADFGQATFDFPWDSTEHDHQVCSRWYRAPELLFGDKHHDRNVDLWSSGCVIAEIRLKKVLFRGDSDILQLVAVIEKLGTPTIEQWPGLGSLPDYGKINFKIINPKPWNEILENIESSAVDLISKLLRYDPLKRISAAEALDHKYFMG